MDGQTSWLSSPHCWRHLWWWKFWLSVGLFPLSRSSYWLNRQTNRQISRWTDRQTNSHLLIAGDICDGGSFDYRLIYALYQDRVNVQRDREMDGHTDRWTDRQTGRQMDRQTDRWTDRRTDRRADIRADRQADWQTDKLTLTSSLLETSVMVEVLTIGWSMPSMRIQLPAGTLFTSTLYLKHWAVHEIHILFGVLKCYFFNQQVMPCTMMKVNRTEGHWKKFK